MPANMIIKQKISIRNVIVFLTILVLLNTHCAPTGKQFGIVFSANLDGNQDLYRTYSQDFQSMERLSFTPNDTEQYLKITRDGDRILFSVLGKNLGWSAYIMDLKTKTTTELRDPALELRSIIPLSWSIDENQALVLEKQTGKIYTVNPNEKSVKELKIPPSEANEVYELSYSPDGNQALYSRNNKYTDPIFTSFLYDLATKAEIQLGNPTAMCSHPQWSPNGKQILLYCDLSNDGISEDNHIYIFNVISNDPIAIKETADLPCGLQFGWSPGAKFAWSPDGTQFAAAYCKMNDDPRSFFIFNSDGSVNRGFPQLGTPVNPIYISEMSWSPEGQKIFYIAGKDENSLNIYMMDVDGSNNHAITTQPSNYSELSIYSLEP